MAKKTAEKQKEAAAAPLEQEKAQAEPPERKPSRNVSSSAKAKTHGSVQMSRNRQDFSKKTEGADSNARSNSQETSAACRRGRTRRKLVVEKSDRVLRSQSATLEALPLERSLSKVRAVSSQRTSTGKKKLF